MAAAIITNRSSANAGRRDIQKARAAEIFHQIDDICVKLGSGAKLPTHKDLMRQLGASERMTLGALEQLERMGRIERRYGSGTYVSDIIGGKTGSIAPAAEATKTQSIVAFATPDYAYFDRCVRHLFDLAGAQDLDVVFRPVTQERLPDIDDLAAVGYVVFRRDLLPLARTLQAAGKKVVSIATPIDGQQIDVPSVYGDQDRGGYLLIKHLIDLGHRRINLAFGDGPRSLRERGIDRAIAEAARRGVEVRVAKRSQADVARLESDAQFLREYVDAPDAPTAIVAWNDENAARIIGALSRAGVSVPGRISVTGYDSSPESERMHPSLTTIEPFIDDQLRAAVDILTGSEMPASNKSVVVVPQLIARDSTARIGETK